MDTMKLESPLDSNIFILLTVLHEMHKQCNSVKKKKQNILYILHMYLIYHFLANEFLLPVDFNHLSTADNGSY